MVSRTGVMNALRSVPIRTRRNWCALNGGCARCREMGRVDRKALRCAGPAHWSDTQISAAYNELVVDTHPTAPAYTAPADVTALEKRVTVLESKRPITTTIVVGEAKPVTFPEGTFVHEALPAIVACAKAGLPTMLVGPTGSGKSELAKHVAHALGLSFAFNSVTAGISEGVLMGRLLPTGKGASMEYHRSDLIRQYEDGGVFAAEEFDSIDANTALVLNNLLANGHASVPHRVGHTEAHRHKQFVFLANANTYGTGADRQYVGRGQLDAATLSRFDVSTIHVGYDSKLEEHIIPEDILAWVRGVRQVIEEHKLRRTCSTRTGCSAKKLEAVGVARSEWVARYFASWSREEIAKVPYNVQKGQV